MLISGSSGGIGVATAQAFAQNGWKVWAGYRHSLPAALKDQKNIHPFYLDVTDEQSIQAGVAKILQEEGRIDALINNAGYGLIAAEECTSLEDVQQLFDVNFFGALRLIQAVTPHMRTQHSGHIINISSTSGVRAVPGLGLYAASKFALEGMSESLAVTLSPWNIHVSIVEPGTVNNQWTQHCIVDTSTEIPVYSKMAQALALKLASLAEMGQSCEEIGALIVQIANTDNPDMRYQTTQKVQETLAKKLVDLTGNKMREEQQHFFDSLTK